MKCPKCGGEQINIQLIQTGAKTRMRKRGILWGVGRFFLILCTCGLWLLVGKSKGKANTKMVNRKTAICQSCGNSWSV
jgi:hypothetical protein